MTRLAGPATWILGAILVAAFVGCGGESEKVTPPAKKAPATSHAAVKTPAPGTLASAATTAAGKPQTVCPVTGDPINRDFYVDYKGERIYFCCGMCPAKFKENPEKYLAQMVKAGIEPEKAPEGAK